MADKEFDILNDKALAFFDDRLPVVFKYNGETLRKLSAIKRNVSNTNAVNYTSEYRKNLLNLQVEGNTTQKTYAGYNLLNKEDFNQEGLRNETAVQLHVNTVLSNEVVNSIFKPNTTYTMSYEVEGVEGVPDGAITTNSTTFILFSPTSAQFWISAGRIVKTGETLQVSLTFTTPENFYESNYIMRGYSGRYTLDGVGIFATCIFRNVQIVEGSTQKPYEPYVGGIPSPNPDYPQKIENANSEGMSVILHGENLFNQNAMLEDSDCTKVEYKGFECIKIAPTKVEFLFPLEIPANSTFRMSFECAFPNGIDTYWYFKYEDGTKSTISVFSRSNASTRENFVLIRPSDIAETTAIGKLFNNTTKKIVGIRAFFYTYTTLTPLYIKNFMVNMGTEHLPYEPYFREEIAIPASVEVEGESVPLRFAKYKNADYLLMQKSEVKYYQFSTEGDPTKPLSQQIENIPPIEYDITDTDLGQSLLDLTNKIPYGTIYIDVGSNLNVPISVDYAKWGGALDE